MPIVDENKIDRTGESLTPEMAQKGEEIKDESPKEDDTKAKAKEESSKADDEAKAKSDAQKAENEAKAKADADDKAKSNLSEKKRSIYDDLKEKKQEAREAKSTAEAAIAENEALKAENAALKELAKSAKEAKTPEEKEALDDEIKEVAEAIGGDPKAVKTLTDFLQKKLAKTGNIQISKEDLDLIKEMKEKLSKSDAETSFKAEWNEFVPSFKKEFPHISDEDLKSVQKKVFELAHTTKFHDKEIDYIYFKNKELLSKLVSPKRPSIESAGNGNPVDEKPTPVELSSRSSPMDVQNEVQRDRHSSSSLEIRRTR